MPDRITTREAAIEEMLRWANGEKSHWNTFHAAVGQYQHSSSEAASAALAHCYMADAAEAQKWAAVAEALRSGLKPPTPPAATSAPPTPSSHPSR